ncbi:MAG: CRISPR-associated endonuclease Cas2, partial [Muribaculaceae bacterium]|nr:CRISPR-associated endonuclease Cas2 [Muribaculaceae bacterium]
MVMRAKKNFVVIAYDIADDRRRNKVMKVLEKVGTRINLSVFECMLTDRQFEKLKKDIYDKINIKEDSVAYYPICVN